MVETTEGRDAEVARIAAAIGPTVGRWFEAGYDAGRLDHVSLAEQITPLVIASLRSTSRDSETPDLSCPKCGVNSHDNDGEGWTHACDQRFIGALAALPDRFTVISTSRDSEVREAIDNPPEGMSASAAYGWEIARKRVLAILDRSSAGIVQPRPEVAAWCVECGEAWPCAATVEGRKDGIPHRASGRSSEAAPTCCIEDFTLEGGSFGPCARCGSEAPHVRLTPS